VGCEINDSGLIRNADMIFIRFVVMHQPNPQKFLETIINKMKPGATILIFEPFSDIKAYEELSKDNLELATALKKRLEYKLILADNEHRDPNYAPKICSDLKKLSMENVFEDVTHMGNIKLGDMKELFIKNYEMMKKRIDEDYISDIDSYIKTINEADDSITTYLGTAHIIFGTKSA
jgi:hypothetical protein